MYLVHDTIGFIHLLFAIISMISGTMILIMRKGTLNHKRVGYIYVSAMVGVLITAFMIYRLWGGWGLFHYAAVVSSVTLLGGMTPIIFEIPKDRFVAFHFSFMYWSVMGLYGAFFAEIMTRAPSLIYGGPPDAVFFQILSIIVGLVMAIGGFFFYKNKDRWEHEFSRFRGK